MRKIRVVTVAAAVVAVAAVVLSGCGGSSSSSSASKGSPLRIGLLAPYSGIYAVAGPPISDGVKLWLSEHHNRLAGHRVELFQGDDKSTTQGEVTAANNLIRQHDVQAVVGLVNSAGALAARPTLMRSKIITMSVVANATELLDVQKGPYLFMVNAAANETAAPSAVLAQRQGWDNVVGVADNYVGARTWLDPSLDAMGKLGVSVQKRIYPNFPTSDYGPYMSKIASGGKPGLVYPVMFGPDALAFLRQYRSFGLDAPIFTTGSMLEPTTGSADLLRAAKGAYAYWNYSPSLDIPENKRFVAAFQKRYGHAPGGFEMQAYVAMEFLDKAYAKAGDDAKPDAVRNAMRQVTVDSPVGQLTLGDRQAVSWDVYLTKVGTGPDGAPALIPTGPYVKDAHPDMTTAEAKAALTSTGGQ